jgi:oligopeptide/dipeptide ABC transporter ATP-binding protein
MLLSVKGLTAHYQTPTGLVKAVEDVNFDLNKNESLAIVGESGCGKTTLALCITKILKQPGRIVSGQVLFEGRDILTMPDNELRQIRGARVGMIFQQPQAYLNPVLKSGFQIAEVLEIHQGYDHQRAMREAVRLLKEVGIASPEETIHRYPFELSGGMAQRVIIAMALACSPSLIIADEPTSALDVTVQAQILETIRRLREEHQTSLILITHDLSLAAEACAKIVVMYAGKSIEAGDRESIFKHPKHPYTQLLIASIPKIGSSEEFPGIAGSPPNLVNPPTGCRFHPRCPQVMDVCLNMEPHPTLAGSGQKVACHLYK